MALTLLSLSFLGFLVLGVPVAFSIGLAAIVAIVLVALWTRMVGGRPTATNRI